MTVDPAIGWAAALGLAGLLGAAAVHKLSAPGRFRTIVAGYRLVPPDLAAPVAAGVIAAETAAALLLALPDGRSAGATVAAALLTAYAGALAVNLRRGRTRIDCGCLGAAGADRIGWWMVGRNVLLVGVAAVAALPAGLRELEPVDRLTIGGMVAAAALLYGAGSRLAAVPREAR